ncbi:MAG: GNAT family N-acetyltransferase [Vallitaleaceae bacterium]|nr:GNAT family N-acetyltransferase [Vallitaleaceae bacterium]
MEIPFGSHAYETSLELRDEVLRKPLGRSIYQEDLSQDLKSHHLAAFLNHTQCVGILLMTPTSATEIKMRQVAVKEELRGLNIGKYLVAFAEETALKLGFNKIVLNSRKTAIPFYEKQGYSKSGDEFLEVTLPHIRMEKILQKGL